MALVMVSEINALTKGSEKMTEQIEKVVSDVVATVTMAITHTT